MKSKLLKYGLVLLVSIAVVGLSGFALWALLNPFNQKAFQQELWSQGDPDVRAAMAKDVIQDLPPGSPEAIIEPLLGKPMEVIPRARLMGKPPRETTHTFAYWLGGWSSFAYDSTFLWVHIDGNGKIIKAEIGGY
jgi:hypothetical protein